MILKASTIRSVGHSRKMAAHLFKDENETIRVRDSFDGVGGLDDVENTLVEMQLYSRMTKGSTGIFTVAISPREDESLTEEQKQEAIEMIEAEFGLQGQVRFEVDHEKDGRWHSHQFWSLVNQEEQKLIDVKNYKRRLMERAREMEQKFDHKITPSETTETTLEVSNADRMRQTKIRPAVERKREISAIWNETETAEEFMQQMRLSGYAVAKGGWGEQTSGNRRKAAIVILDQDGQAYNLARELPKMVKTKDVLERFGALQYELQDVRLAREQQIKEAQQKSEYWDREQYEIEQQHKLSDAAAEAARRSGPKEKETTQKKQETVKAFQPEEEALKRAAMKEKAIKERQAFFEPYADQYERRMQAKLNWQRESAQARSRLEAEQERLYGRKESLNRLQALREKIQRHDTMYGRLSGKLKTLQEDLAKEEMNLANIDQRIEEQKAALEMKLNRQKPEENPDSGVSNDNVDQTAKMLRQQAIERSVKAMEEAEKQRRNLKPGLNP